MIRVLLLGAARLLFSLATIAAIVTALLLYASWRCLRVVVKGAPATPVKDAALASTLSLVTLARALKERMPDA